MKNYIIGVVLSVVAFIGCSTPKMEIRKMSVADFNHLQVCGEMAEFMASDTYKDPDSIINLFGEPHGVYRDGKYLHLQYRCKARHPHNSKNVNLESCNHDPRIPKGQSHAIFMVDLNNGKANGWTFKCGAEQ